MRQLVVLETAAARLKASLSIAVRKRGSDFDFGGPASREAQTAGLVGLSLCASDPLYSSWSLGDKQFTLSMWNTTMGATAVSRAIPEPPKAE